MDNSCRHRDRQRDRQYGANITVVMDTRWLPMHLRVSNPVSDGPPPHRKEDPRKTENKGAPRNTAKRAGTEASEKRKETGRDGTRRPVPSSVELDAFIGTVTAGQRRRGHGPTVLNHTTSLVVGRKWIFHVTIQNQRVLNPWK